MPDLNIPLYVDAGFSAFEMRALESLLASNPSIHWIKLTDEGTYELILDNSIMSCFRTCPSLFMMTWVEGFAPKIGKSWILDFGTIFHKLVEIYYKEFRTPGFDRIKWATEIAKEEWIAANMKFHRDHKEYNTIGGLPGFASLLLEYASRFSADNERIRVIGTEIAFGRNREVPLGSVYNMVRDAPRSDFANVYLRVFLAGRIDVLIDDRTSIGPLDHKTKGSFRGDPSKFYEIDEGPTGYIYAVNQILPKLLKELNLEESLLERSCNKILMNYISKTPTQDPAERFKRLPIFKTSDQLESYRRRMLLTAEDLFRALIRYAVSKEASRSTNNCTGLYGSDCPFLAVHRQVSKENELMMLSANYEKRPIWNTEEA